MNEPLKDKCTNIFRNLSESLQGPRVVFYDSLGQTSSKEFSNVANSGITLERLCLEETSPIPCVNEEKDFFSPTDDEASTFPSGVMHYQHPSSPSRSDDGKFKGDLKSEVSDAFSVFWRQHAIETNLSFFSFLSMASGMESAASKKGRRRLAVRCQVISVLRDPTEHVKVEMDCQPFPNLFEGNTTKSIAGAGIENTKGVADRGEMRSWCDTSCKTASSREDTLGMILWNVARMPGLSLSPPLLFPFSPPPEFTSTHSTPTRSACEAEVASGSKGSGERGETMEMSLAEIALQEEASEGVWIPQTRGVITRVKKKMYVRLAPPIPAACLFCRFHTHTVCSNLPDSMMPSEEKDPYCGAFSDTGKCVGRNEQPQWESPHRYSCASEKSSPGKTFCRSDGGTLHDEMSEGGVDRNWDVNGIQKKSLAPSMSTGFEKSDLEALAWLFPAVHCGRVFDDSDAFVAHCQDVQDHLLWCEHLPLFPLQIVKGYSPLSPPTLPSKECTPGNFREKPNDFSGRSSPRLSSAGRKEAITGLEMFWLLSTGEIGDFFLNDALNNVLGCLDKCGSTPTIPTSQELPSLNHSYLLHWFTLLYTELAEWNRASLSNDTEEASRFSNISSKGEEEVELGVLPSWIHFLTVLGVAERIVRQLSTSPAKGHRFGSEENSFACKEMPKVACGTSLASESYPYVDWTSLYSVAKFIYGAIEDCWFAMLAAKKASLHEIGTPEDAAKIHTGCEVVHRHQKDDTYQSEYLSRSFENLFCRSVCAWLPSSDAMLPMQPSAGQQVECASERQVQNASDIFRCHKKNRNEYFHQSEDKHLTRDCGWKNQDPEREEEEEKNGLNGAVQRLAATLAIPLALFITKYMRRKEVSSRLLQLTKQCESANVSPPPSVSASVGADTASSPRTPPLQKIRSAEKGAPGSSKSFSPNRSSPCAHLSEMAAEKDKFRHSERRCHSRAKRGRGITESPLQSRAGGDSDPSEHAKSDKEGGEVVSTHQKFMDLLLLLFLNPAENASDG